MPRRRWALLAVFVAWTTYVWVTRITNTWGSDIETTGAKVFSTVLSGVMLALAVGGVVVLVQTWKRPLTVGAARFLQVFCGVTVVVWLVRAVQIIASDHDVAVQGGARRARRDLHRPGRRRVAHRRPGRRSSLVRPPRRRWHRSPARRCRRWWPALTPG